MLIAEITFTTMYTLNSKYSLALFKSTLKSNLFQPITGFTQMRIFLPWFISRIAQFANLLLAYIQMKITPTCLTASLAINSIFITFLHHT
jgi:hypothetical protein